MLWVNHTKHLFEFYITNTHLWEENVKSKLKYTWREVCGNAIYIILRYLMKTIKIFCVNLVSEGGTVGIDPTLTQSRCVTGPNILKNVNITEPNAFFTSGMRAKCNSSKRNVYINCNYFWWSINFEPIYIERLV